MRVVFLATAWGAMFGGINAFNHDFAVGLSEEFGAGGEVFCAVVNPLDSHVAEAKRLGVTLIPVTGKGNSGGEFNPAWVDDVTNWLKSERHGSRVDWWIGHDVNSGFAAVDASTKAGGSAALIHHMAYISYQGIKRNDSLRAEEYHQRQRALFSNTAASKLFAGGPLLRRSCRNLSGVNPTQLIPGFPREAVPSTSPDDQLVAVTFGRMDQASDRVKQGRLAAAGFGKAVRQSKRWLGPLEAFRDPRIYVVGIEGGEEESVIRIAEGHAQRAVNLLALPFDPDRQPIFDRLSGANLALMLSWHEGFGLTGWEAIAAEVPLALTKQSGLYELIDETLFDAGLGCVLAIDIEGRRGIGAEPNFTESDLDAVASVILQTGANIPRHKKNARMLRDLLVRHLDCSWGGTARQFLSAVNRERAGG